MAANGGLIGQDDLAAYKVETREPIRGSYRGYEIVGPPPPASSGVHIAQMLNILEGYDIGASTCWRKRSRSPSPTVRWPPPTRPSSRFPSRA